MAVVIRDATFPVEVAVKAPTLTAIREALVRTLANDAPLVALLGTGPIAYRPYRADFGLPAITLLDFGGRPTPRMPLLDRTYQVDVWGHDLDETERIADRIFQLLNDQPLPITNGQARVDYFELIADRDDVADDEGVVSRKTLEFRMLAFEIR